MRHRALLHSSWGIYLAERILGHIITNSDGRIVQVRDVAERHIIEDMGRIRRYRITYRVCPCMIGSVDLSASRNALSI